MKKSTPRTEEVGQLGDVLSVVAVGEERGSGHDAGRNVQMPESSRRR